MFKSLGIAIEDLASAELVVRRAREQGVGIEVALIPLADIEEARERMAVRSSRPARPAASGRRARRDLAQLENLQPIGSFKLRGAANAILTAPREALQAVS